MKSQVIMIPFDPFEKYMPLYMFRITLMLKQYRFFVFLVGKVSVSDVVPVLVPLGFAFWPLFPVPQLFYGTGCRSRTSE